MSSNPRTSVWLLLLAVVSALSACTDTYRDPIAKPSPMAAIIIPNPGEVYTNTYRYSIVKIDGQEISKWEWDGKILVTPGFHDVEIDASRVSSLNLSRTKIRMIAQAGEKYSLAIDYGGPLNIRKLWIKNVRNGKMAGATTLIFGY